jgi:hypothetical protein
MFRFSNGLNSLTRFTKIKSQCNLLKPYNYFSKYNFKIRKFSTSSNHALKQYISPKTEFEKSLKPENYFTSQFNDFSDYKDMIDLNIETITTSELEKLKKITLNCDQFVYKMCYDEHKKLYLIVLEIPSGLKIHMCNDYYIKNSYATYSARYGITKQIIDINNMKNVNRVVQHNSDDDLKSIIHEIYEIGRYQAITDFNKGSDQIYFNKNIQKLYFEHIKIPTNYNGIWIAFGDKNMSYNLTEYKNGKKHGRFIWFNYSSKENKFNIAQVGFFEENKKSGLWRTWDLSNDNKMFSHYVDGYLYGERRAVNSYGTLLFNDYYY